MIRLSVNVMTSVSKLIGWIGQYKINSVSELPYLRITSISVEDLIELGKKCGWITCDRGITVLELTSGGNDIYSLIIQNKFREAQRLIIADYITKIKPAWANRIPYGRREAAIFMTKDEKACFFETNLLSEDVDDTIVEWWDIIAKSLRTQQSQYKEDIGRAGERRTIDFEKKRTGIAPQWKSIDSNLLGYDIISQISETNPNQLLIEVKTSCSDSEYAFFHITANEWRVAQSNSSYRFYIWHLNGSDSKLAILISEDVRPYIPINNLQGEWESVKIPFSCFQDRFIMIE